MTTRGRALFRDRQPAAWAAVRVTGCPVQQVGADGTFDTTCAAPVYDVALRYINIGVLYRGLTRRDPVLTVPSDWSNGSSSCTVSGEVTGLASGELAGVSLTSADHSAATSPSLDGNYSAWLEWHGATALPATVRALGWTEDGSGISAFTGYGAAEVALSNGVDQTASPALGAIANGSIAVTTNSGSYSFYDLWITWPEGGVTRLQRASGGTTGGSVPTPAVPGATFTVAAERGQNPVSWAWRRGLAATSAPAEMAIPAAPVFTAPPANSTVDLSTAFTFDGIADAVYMLAFESATLGGPLLYLVTGETTARIPDFTWAELPLPSATGMTAKVYALGPISSVDEAAVSVDPMNYYPPEWVGWSANRVPPVDGFATLYTMDVVTP